MPAALPSPPFAPSAPSTFAPPSPSPCDPPGDPSPAFASPIPPTPFPTPGSVFVGVGFGGRIGRPFFAFFTGSPSAVSGTGGGSFLAPRPRLGRGEALKAEGSGRGVRVEGRELGGVGAWASMARLAAPRAEVGEGAV